MLCSTFSFRLFFVYLVVAVASPTFLDSQLILAQVNIGNYQTALDPSVYGDSVISNQRAFHQVARQQEKQKAGPKQPMQPKPPRSQQPPQPPKPPKSQPIQHEAGPGERGNWTHSDSMNTGASPIWNDGCCSTCGEQGFMGQCRCRPQGRQLFHRTPSACRTIQGWLSTGYHSQSTDLFNEQPDDFNVHQAYLYAEKLALPTNNGWGFGYRADIMYGIDADELQSFGNDNGVFDFDNGFQHGRYGWAIPQLYAEFANQNWTAKLGHFFSGVGFEDPRAPKNFFYSRSITSFFEPFTVTGATLSRQLNACTKVHAGWILGWDTGFDNFNGGNSFLGGFSTALSQFTNFAFTTSFGNFGRRGDDGYLHSIVVDTSLTDRLVYVVQSDLLRVDSTGEDNFGINQYLFYDWSDRVSLGFRGEWWKGDAVAGYAPHGGVIPVAGGSFSYFATTFGLNYKMGENMTVRPEIRYDWSPAVNYDESIFGIDFVMTF